MRTVGSKIVRSIGILFLAGSFHPAISPADRGSANPEPGPARIWLGGDLQPGSGQEDILAPLVPLLQGIPGIVNLEGPVAAPNRNRGVSIDSTTGRVINEPGAIPRLNTLNIRVAGIANNHRGDLGEAGVGNTLAALRAASILPAGAPVGPAILATPDLRIVVSAHDLGDGVPDSLGAMLERDRRRGDALIVLFHVTGPASYLPRKELKEAVEITIAAGASVIAASGTHVVGPVERRGNTVIAWGLGNLAFECRCTLETDAILLLVTLTKEGCSEAAILPIDAGIHGRPTRPAADPDGLFDLMKAIGSSEFQRAGDRALLLHPAGAPD